MQLCIINLYETIQNIEKTTEISVLSNTLFIFHTQLNIQIQFYMKI